MLTATTPGELAGIADQLDHLARIAAPGGPIDRLLTAAAGQIKASAEAIVDGCCPACGAGSARHWREQEIRRLAQIAASYEERLIDSDDVIRLMGHTRKEAL
jgi:hypothetical protein